MKVIVKTVIVCILAGLMFFGVASCSQSLNSNGTNFLSEEDFMSDEDYARYTLGRNNAGNGESGTGGKGSSNKATISVD